MLSAGAFVSIYANLIAMKTVSMGKIYEVEFYILNKHMTINTIH